MAPVTRRMSDYQDTWQHVLDKVQLYEEHDNLRSGLTALGIKDMADCLSMELEDFKGFEFFFCTAGDKLDDPAVEHVGSFPLVEFKKYIQLQQWYINQPDKEVGTWFSLNVDTFYQWRLTSQIKMEDTQVAVSSSSNNSKKAEISQFSARPKLFDYNPLMPDKEWHAWARHVLIMEASHLCDIVLELSNPPTTPDEHQVFDLQNKFMFSMLSKKLLTSKGKVSLGKQQATKDSNALWQKLEKAYQGHVETNIDSGSIQNMLVTFHIGNSQERAIVASVTCGNSLFMTWKMLMIFWSMSPTRDPASIKPS
jgi:hypothetical protein